MFSIMFDILKVVWSFLCVPIVLILALICVFIVLIALHIVIGYTQGRRLPKGIFRQKKKRAIFLRLGWDLPKQIANDMFNRDPFEFPYKGCVIFTGRQGNGKTIALVHFSMAMRSEYPDSKVLSNLDIAFQDEELNHWKKLVNYKNGPLGVIACIDETQNWFSSNQSRNFPPEMLQVITQNRKNRRIILGTAQNFYMLAKNIRSQCTEVRECFTLFGCLTVVRRREPILDNDGNVVEFKKRGTYFFVHNDELRNNYDTYRVIESLAESGFKETVDALPQTS